MQRHVGLPSRQLLGVPFRDATSTCFTNTAWSCLIFTSNAYLETHNCFFILQDKGFLHLQSMPTHSSQREQE